MTNQPKILIIDDDQAIIQNMVPFLERTGFIVEAAFDGQSGLTKIQQTTPDLILLDVIMPHMNGREVLRQLRRSDNWVPVILLTQVGDATERAIALEEGADDYLNKPFEPQELVARMHAVLRRYNPNKPPLNAAQKLASHDIILDRTARRVLHQNHEVNLTPKAITLLDYLMTHPEEIISRERLLEVIWGWADPVGIRTVDTRVAELRRMLGDTHRYIETVAGEGYRFVGKVEILT